MNELFQADLTGLEEVWKVDDVLNDLVTEAYVLKHGPYTAYIHEDGRVVLTKNETGIYSRSYQQMIDIEDFPSFVLVLVVLLQRAHGYYDGAEAWRP